MSRLTLDRTAEPVLQHQILRHEWGQCKGNFPIQLTKSRINNLTWNYILLNVLIKQYTMRAAPCLILAIIATTNTVYFEGLFGEAERICQLERKPVLAIV